MEGTNLNDSIFWNDTGPDTFHPLQVPISINNRVALWIIDAFGSLLGTVGNLFVLVVILRTKRLRTKTNTLLMSLIVSGLLMSTTLQPIRADQMNPYFTVGLPYNIANAASIVAYFSCILSIFCVTLERFIAVWKPFRHVTLVTSLRIKIVLALVWCSSILAGATLYDPLHRAIFDHLALVNFTFVIFSSVVMYGYIFSIAHKQRQFMRRQSFPVHNGHNGIDNSTIICAIFFTIFIVLWLPTLVYLYLQYLGFLERFQPEDVFTSGQYLISLHLWNGSINWYVYCWKCDQFKSALSKFWGRWYRNRNYIPGDNMTNNCTIQMDDTYRKESGDAAINGRDC